MCTALTRQTATDTVELIRPQNARPHFSSICLNWNPSVTDHKHLKGLIPPPLECTTKIKVVLLSNKSYITVNIIFSDGPNIECWRKISTSWSQTFHSVFQNALYYKQLKRTGSLLLRRSIHLFQNGSRDINVRLSGKLDISSVCSASEYYPNTRYSWQKCH